MTSNALPATHLDLDPEPLLAWFDALGRPLAIREADGPWAVLVGEVMSQQTQIERVGDAWRAFLRRFPTPAALASAPTAHVVLAWRGLGYNRRAINLQRAARELVERHGGEVPADLDALQALPGVGPYTARATAALAFGIPVAAVDVNVRRVVTRLVGRPLRPRDLQSLADALVSRDRPDAWTHAVMDLAAAICRPVAPRCDACPLRAGCLTAATLAADPASSDPARTSAATRSRPHGAASPATPATPFPETRRWLRGRIVHRLCESPGEWIRFDEPIGTHAADAVADALDGLERDGLLVRREDGAATLP